MQFFEIYFSCLSLIAFCEAARILVMVPAPFVSHQVVFRPLTQELAKRGHKVTVVTTDPAFPKGQTPDNLTEIDLHDVTYEIVRKEIIKSSTRGKKKHLLTQYETVFHIFNILFEKQVQNQEFQEILKKDKNHFDLLILELCMRQPLVLSHVFKAPVIQISSFGPGLETYNLMGGPSHLFFYPNSFRQRIYNLTVWEKIKEMYTFYSLWNLCDKKEKEANDMIRRNFGPDVPELSKLKENVDMIFLNMHPLLEGNFPVPQTVQHIWGIHAITKKELPKDLKDYLDYSKHGVIYMSFGTNTDPTLLPPEKIQVFVRVFSKLPYDVLWKWDGDELPGRTDNIKISKWLPQSDLLKHPKIKLFITQGGLHSTDEAITAGVPLVGVPMFGDQWYNVEKYEQLKIGVKLDFEYLTDEVLREAITTVIFDDSYRENIVRLRRLMRDQPQTPLERDQPQTPLQRAVWWTEHVLRHAGAAHLRAPAANMHWTRYYEIELVLTLLAVLVIVLTLCSIIIYQIIKFLKNKISSVKNKVK